MFEDANAFVVSLDCERFWFRYHSLFADLLLLELRPMSPIPSRGCTTTLLSGTPSTIS